MPGSWKFDKFDQETKNRMISDYKGERKKISSEHSRTQNVTYLLYDSCGIGFYKVYLGTSEKK